MPFLSACRITGAFLARSALVTALTLAIAATAARAEYFTYSDWSQAPADFRAAYVAGLYDALVSFADSDKEAKVGTHYQDCVVRAKITSSQLAERTLLLESRDQTYDPAELAKL
jgi:hypothetical protein